MPGTAMLTYWPGRKPSRRRSTSSEKAIAVSRQALHRAQFGAGKPRLSVLQTSEEAGDPHHAVRFRPHLAGRGHSLRAASSSVSASSM